MKKTHIVIAAVVFVGVATNLSCKVQAGPIRVDGTSLGAGVASALPASDSPESVVAPGFSLGLLAQGIDALENPSGVITHFGFLSDAAATGTEPDENTYLVLDHNPGGPSPGYDYGRRFLFQGHENGGDVAYVTRVNLDVVNPDHRITLLTPVGASGLTGVNRIDGSVWNPHSQTLLFTQEDSARGGVFEMSAEWDAVSGRAAGIRTLYGSMGIGGFEGIHPDDRGNILLVEDAGGSAVSVDPNNVHGLKKARLPNSFVYRFVPTSPGDLSQGKLQGLQVTINGAPLHFIPIDATHPFGDVYSDNQLLLHTLGTSWPCHWVTIHDTAVDGAAPFNANAAAKSAGATPFKRPENGQFRPGSDFRSFFFDITGDTDAASGNNPALAARGAWGGIFRLDLDKTGDQGTLSLVVLGDADHAAFDNVAFVSRDVLLVTEDRGDSLHAQLNKLDSIWAYDVGQSPSASARLLALGRDRVATGIEDNEPTGLVFSDGDSSVNGLLGRKPAKTGNAFLFFTMQHGENNLYVVQGQNPSASEDN